jgi:hypothetical protein
MSRNLAASAALIGALVAGGGPIAATADFYSPVAAGIDKVCSPVAGGSASKTTVRLARLDGADGTPGPWLRSSPSLEEHVVNASGFAGGDFAIVNESVALFTASVTHRDAATATGTQTKAWCFEGGKLSRATTETIDLPNQTEWRHTQYFDRDPDAPSADVINTTPLNGRAAPVPQPSPAVIAIDRYHTPADLPFYNVYKSALAGKLPMLTAPS